MIIAVNLLFKQLQHRSTCDRHNTGVMLYQLSYWSHTLGARSIVSSYFSWEEWNDVMYMKWFIYELQMYIKVINDHRRSLKKNFRIQRDSNPWPPRYWCSALPTELLKPHIESEVNCEFIFSRVRTRVKNQPGSWRDLGGDPGSNPGGNLAGIMAAWILPPGGNPGSNPRGILVGNKNPGGHNPGKIPAGISTGIPDGISPSWRDLGGILVRGRIQAQDPGLFFTRGVKWCNVNEMIHNMNKLYELRMYIKVIKLVIIAVNFQFKQLE